MTHCHWVMIQSNIFSHFVWGCLFKDNQKGRTKIHPFCGLQIQLQTGGYGEGCQLWSLGKTEAHGLAVMALPARYFFCRIYESSKNCLKLSREWENNSIVRLPSEIFLGLQKQQYRDCDGPTFQNLSAKTRQYAADTLLWFLFKHALGQRPFHRLAYFSSISPVP